MKCFSFDFKLSIFLIAAFILMTVAGTLTHELGHYSVARLLGYEASVNYRSSSHWNDSLDRYFSDVYHRYPEEIKNGSDFPEKKAYLKAIQQYRADYLWISVGGPMQTMLTGTFGFVLLICFRKKLINEEHVRFGGWVLIFITLFWLRQVANLAVGVGAFLLDGHTTLSGDEMWMAKLSGINIWTIQAVSGIIGIGVLIQVIRWLPKHQVLTFLISGMVGGCLGYYLWLIRFGQYILPDTGRGLIFPKDSLKQEIMNYFRQKDCHLTVAKFNRN